MIDVKGLKKNYGGLQVLKGVDLTINKGDCVVLVGPSGCGKSTFLRCLNRLEEPDGGHVIFNGKEVTDHDIDHVRQKMGMVFQHFNLFPHLTVKKNITLAPVRLGLMKQPEADKKAMELLERIGLADKADTYPNMLFGRPLFCLRGRPPGGYGIRPYAFTAHDILLLLYTPRQVDSLRKMW